MADNLCPLLGFSARLIGDIVAPMGPDELQPSVQFEKNCYQLLLDSVGETIAVIFNNPILSSQQMLVN